MNFRKKDHSTWLEHFNRKFSKESNTPADCLNRRNKEMFSNSTEGRWSPSSSVWKQWRTEASEPNRTQRRTTRTRASHRTWSVIGNRTFASTVTWKKEQESPPNGESVRNATLLDYSSSIWTFSRLRSKILEWLARQKMKNWDHAFQSRKKHFQNRFGIYQERCWLRITKILHIIVICGRPERVGDITSGQDVNSDGVC